MRGRNNNNNNNNNNGGNRKGGPNPLTRSYESNGPDVKIRGNAQQIADKYMQLARDAQGSGDRVMAENYLQHAEHYNRIIAAAQAQMPVQAPRDNRDDMDDDEDGSFDGQPSFEQASVNDGTGPQPDISPVVGETVQASEADAEQPRENRQASAERNGEEGGGQRRPRRQRRRNRSDRPEGEEGGDDEAPGGEAVAAAPNDAPVNAITKDVAEPAE